MIYACVKSMKALVHVLVQPTRGPCVHCNSWPALTSGDEVPTSGKWCATRRPACSAAGVILIARAMRFHLWVAALKGLGVCRLDGPSHGKKPWRNVDVEKETNPQSVSDFDSWVLCDEVCLSCLPHPWCHIFMLEIHLHCDVHLFLQSSYRFWTWGSNCLGRGYGKSDPATSLAVKIPLRTSSLMDIRWTKPWQNFVPGSAGSRILRKSRSHGTATGKPLLDMLVGGHTLETGDCPCSRSWRRRVAFPSLVAQWVNTPVPGWRMTTHQAGDQPRVRGSRGSKWHGWLAVAGWLNVM